MRWIATRRFQELLADRSNGIRRVAVVGGSTGDPEIAWLLSVNPEIEVTSFGVDPSDDTPFTYLDLNTPTDTSMTFDLVHCAHVLEHVWNVSEAISNLVRLAEPGGLIWINCPASCRAHGSPNYFSSGYQPELISKVMAACDVQVISSGAVGSRRSYFYEHTLRRWPNQAEHDAPLLKVTNGRGGPLMSVIRWLAYFPGRALAALYSGKLTDTPDFATQTYVLGASREY